MGFCAFATMMSLGEQAAYLREFGLLTRPTLWLGAAKGVTTNTVCGSSRLKQRADELRSLQPSSEAFPATPLASSTRHWASPSVIATSASISS